MVPSGKVMWYVPLLVTSALLTSLVDSTSVETKQPPTGLLRSLSALVPQVVSNALPIMLMFGLGALLVPALGLHTLFRESKHRSLSTFNVDLSPFAHEMQDILIRFAKAIDKMENKYNR